MAKTLSSDAKTRAAIVVEASIALVDFEGKYLHSIIDLLDEDDVKSDSATTFSSDVAARLVVVVEASPLLVDFRKNQ